MAGMVRRRASASWSAALALVAMCCLALVPASAVGADNEVLILSRSVSGGANSLEAQAITALGLTPVLADDATWRGMSTGQFRSYRALLIGDTGGNSTSTFQAATDTTNVWGPAISGNQLVIGSDPVGHASQGGRQLVEKGIAFAANRSGKTGFYATLGDAFDGAAADTPVPLLDGLESGGFSIQGAACHNDVRIVAEHPAVASLTDANLSNWGCSVHNQFDRWPARFQVLAIARNRGSVFTGPDGSTGVPYILAAGDAVRSFPLSATPTFAEVPTGQTHTITGQLLDAGTRAPVQGALLRAATETRSGPIVIRDFLRCSTTLCKSDANGQVGFSYTSSVKRSDTVVVFRDANANDAPDVGEEQVRVQVDWVPPSLIPGTLGPGWPHQGGPLRLSFTYPGTQRYLRNVAASAVNWNTAGTNVRFEPWAGVPNRIHLSFADVNKLDGGYWGLAVIANCPNGSQPPCPGFTFNRILLARDQLDRRSDALRTKVFTHELGHALSLRHPGEVGVSRNTPSVMHAADERVSSLYNRPQDYDIDLINRLYP